MRLADFIRTNQKPITTEWESFARTLPTNTPMSKLQLQDHIEEMLSCIAHDLETQQTSAEQVKKSHGKSDSQGHLDGAAETHGDLRHDVGFDIIQMVSEYRALRSSIIKLWTAEKTALTDVDVLDLTRFNESIDQALAESVVRFTAKVDYSKDLLLGVLGHDMRSPLGAINMCAQMISRTGPLNTKQEEFVTQIMNSSMRVVAIAENLLDLTRARLGNGLPVVKARMELGELARQMVKELGTSHPERPIKLMVTGDTNGEWDATRLGQLFSNLIGNAIQYGAKDSPIEITIKGDAKEVSVAIHNEGEPIPSKQRETMFDSFTRGEPAVNSTKMVTPNLGLGLFITKEIVSAHQGAIDLVSTKAEGTTFTVNLPKSASSRTLQAAA